MTQRERAAGETGGVPELVFLRHRACGALMMAIDARTVDNPGRALMCSDVIMMDGSEPKAGARLTCGACGKPVGFGPKWLDIDRGPDARQSLAQRAALYVTSNVLAGKQA